MRKTVDVQKIKEFVNGLLKSSHNDAQGYRNGICDVLEEILHKTDNYQGFGYINQANADEGQTWGINNVPMTEHEKAYPCSLDYSSSWEAKFAGTDRTRRFYY